MWTLIWVGIQQNPGDIRAQIAIWNELLVTFVKGFFVNHKGISMTIYNSSTIFNAVLDEPEKYGFKDSISDCREADCIWQDDGHPAYELHRILTADLAMFLNSI